MKKPDILVALDPIIKAFKKLGISYYIGGSVASSAFGIARATLDVDLVSDVKSHHADSLVEMLESDYYIERDMILDAVKKSLEFDYPRLKWRGITPNSWLPPPRFL